MFDPRTPRRGPPITCTRESEIPKRLLSTLALSLSLGALPLADTVSATETYLSVYQAGVPNIPSVFTGQTTSQLTSTFNSLTGGNTQLFDLESYYDGAGVLRHDSIYNFHPGESGASNLFIGVPVGFVDAIQPAEEASGRRLTELSSSLDASGLRLYTAVFSPGSGAEDLHIGIDHDAQWSQLQSMQFNTFARFPTVYETWYDADGVRRVDAVFQKVGAGTYWFHSNMSESSFLATNAQHEATGQRLYFFESWRDQSGNRRYAARWSNPDILHSPAPIEIVLDEDLPSFLVTYQAMLNAGKRLQDMNVLEDIVPAVSSNYGAGLAGTNGVPTLTLSDKPFLGANTALEMGNSAGAPVLCGIFLGLSQASLDFKGGELLLLPALDPILLPLPSSGLDLPFAVPSDAILDGVQLFAQVAIQDTGAVNGISLSRGLAMTFGAQD
ncbi:MAG: hypothetical protein ACI9EF_002336 [Pseudohongiellaceae bacterium]